MDYIRLSPENLESEHICCAISNAKDPQVIAKKQWLAERLGEGLVFLKADARGKCFIEYIPAENAWAPIAADGYMFIDCLWVSGKLKGQGYSNDLMSECIRDSKEKVKNGLCVISSQKKMPFLSDPKYLEYKGFTVSDSATPYFTLMYLPFYKGAPKPAFKECVKKPKTDSDGFVLYYTHGCPYTAKYVPIVQSAAEKSNIPFKCVHIDSREKAQSAPAPWTNYALFYNGEFVTNEILSENKFISLAEKLIREL